ncbi:SGNH/GDSL hydrolase family protein [Francisella uliginis]|uniref:SGNH/GDSL hydrolase family protein n=1 Tax=Francisella uliginis TaxID=573570 RepID=UPI0011AB555E
MDKAIQILISKKNAKHILVLNLPDFSKAPRYFNASNSKRTEIYNKVVETNTNIEKVVSKYKQQCIDIKIIDFYSLLNKLIETKKYISDKPCLDIQLKTDKLDYLLDYDKTANCHKNIDKYIFFDNLHPTNSVHKKIAFLASRNF